MIEFDERDAAILAQRQELLNQVPGPRVGDWVDFVDGTRRRISHIWPDGAQTSDGGSYYLGPGYVSMSGALHSSVSLESLVRTEQQRPGGIWFFHHDFPGAHRGVDRLIPFRVYTCGLPAPR